MTPLSGLKLLVVEDEALVAMLVEDLLTDLGCIVVEVVGNLEAGMAMATSEARSFDFAILDVNLGSAKAFPIASELKARGIKFVFATGYGAAGLEPDFADSPVLAKPFRRDVLEKTLVAALA